MERFLLRYARWRDLGVSRPLAFRLARQRRWPVWGGAFPVNIDKNAPAATDSPGGGDDEFRKLKTQIEDLFGIPDATNITAALCSLGSLVDGKLATDFVVKAASPRTGRTIGTEASFVDYSWQEDAGVLKLDANTGTEAAPTWTTRLEIALATGNISWLSGTSFKGTFDHAATAARTWTFPDVTGTVALLERAQDFTKTQGWAKGADLASAATLTLGTDGNYFDVTGTVTITALSSATAGTVVVLRFVAALTLTHNGASLILPGAANIATAAGDVAAFVSLGAGNWRCVGYLRASAAPVPSGTSALVGTDATQTLTNKTLTTPVVSGAAPATPTANVLYADSVVKGWLETSGAGVWTIDADLNVASITDNAAGDFTINWATAFANANYAVAGCVIGADFFLRESTATAKSTTAVRLTTVSDTGVTTDPGTGVSVIAIGVQ